MTYATQQLTNALQELTHRSGQFEVKIIQTLPSVITADQLTFSKDVEIFVEQKREYSERTRSVNVGRY